MKTENRKTLRGSVLFTVICVMALLIIFLTGTLALASASSNRAHKSYASSQASYTARAAIDAFVQSMEREAGIPAAIEDMGSDPLDVEMKLNDPSLGVIGSYSEGVWREGKIIIEPVANSDSYMYTDLGDGNGARWVAVNAVKVTATCRVGREEETASAYIRKTAGTHNEQSPGGLDGLQEVGGNSFGNGGLITGGFGLGISKDATGLYVAHNQTTVETKSTFINGNLVIGTSSFEINIKNPVSESGVKLMPNSKTAIMGSVFVHHTKALVNLDYEMTSDYSQKDIPYLYIDQTIAGDAGLEIGRVRKNNAYANQKGKAPFNVFIGTLNCAKTVNDIQIGGADLYLLDEYTPSEKYTVMYADRSYSVDELAKEDVSRSTTDDITGIVKGDNYFGKSSSSAVLYDWESSFIHKTDSQHKSTGGNLYSMGNLTLQNCTVNGEVRVNGDCTIKNGVTIKKDLIVKGTLTFDGGDTNSVQGEIYCDTVSGVSTTKEEEQIKPGYTEHRDELVDGYIPIPNASYNNDAVPETEYEFIQAEKKEEYGWKVGIVFPGATEPTILGWENDDYEGAPAKEFAIYAVGNKWTRNKPYYVTKYDGTVDHDDIIDSPVSRYKVDPNDTDTILDEPTDDEFSYYKLNENGTVGDPADKSDAVRTYYTNPAGEIVSQAEAFQNVTVGAFPAYSGSGKEPAYPASMTREAIYGEEDPDTHEFKPADSKTRLVKNVVEVRQELNMDKNGNYDENVYYNHVPKKFCTNASDSTFIDDPNDPLYNTPENKAKRNKLPYAYNSDGTPNTSSGVWSDGKIIRSCIIGDPEDDTKAFTPNGNVNIQGSGEGIWIILRNVHTESKHNLDFLCDTSAGKVCFLIDGTLDISKTDIRPTVTGGGVQAYTSGCKVTPKSCWGIEYYGTEGSAIDMYQNECTLVGTFMCPNTTFSNKVQCKTPCKYVDEYGVERTNTQAPIVGSALFNKITDAQNSFGVLNSGGAGATNNTKNVYTALGTYEISYFTGS